MVPKEGPHTSFGPRDQLAAQQAVGRGGKKPSGRSLRGEYEPMVSSVRLPQGDIMIGNQLVFVVFSQRETARPPE